jgi:hypothetical protein
MRRARAQAGSKISRFVSQRSKGRLLGPQPGPEGQQGEAGQRQSFSRAESPDTFQRWQQRQSASDVQDLVVTGTGYAAQKRPSAVGPPVGPPSPTADEQDYEADEDWAASPERGASAAAERPDLQAEAGGTGRAREEADPEAPRAFVLPVEGQEEENVAEEGGGQTDKQPDAPQAIPSMEEAVMIGTPGAEEARFITRGLRKSASAALASVSSSVERRQYLQALNSIVKVQAFVRMMLAYLPYARRRSSRASTGSSSKDDYSSDSVQEEETPRRPDVTPPTTEPPAPAVKRRPAPSEGQALLTIQRVARRFVAQRKASRLLRPFTAVLRLVDFSGLVLGDWLRGVEWYFSVVHRDLEGSFKALLKTRSVKIDRTRVLGQGLVLRGVRLTDRIEVSLMCRVCLEGARLQRPELRQSGYKVVNDDLVSPWASLYDREIHLMALNERRQRLVLPLSGRGGRFKVPLLPVAGLDSTVAAWLVDGNFKVNLDAPWPKDAEAEALCPTAALAERRPELLLEATPVPFHSTPTLALVCRGLHLLDAVKFSKVSELQVSTGSDLRRLTCGCTAGSAELFGAWPSSAGFPLARGGHRRARERPVRSPAKLQAVSVAAYRVGGLAGHAVLQAVPDVLSPPLRGPVPSHRHGRGEHRWVGPNGAR